MSAQDQYGRVLTYLEFAEMTRGAEACERGEELPDNASPIFKYGYAQACQEGESHEVDH